MATTTRSPIDAAVLNTIQALAADLALDHGMMSATGLGNSVKVADWVEVTKTAFAAGTASVKTADMGAITLTASTAYSITVSVPSAVVYGGPDPDPLYFQRTYSFYSGTVAPTAAEVAQQFVDLINADPQARVSAALTVVDRVTCTLLDVADGDFSFTNYPTGTVLATTTPYVAPAGTNAIVNALAPGEGTAGNYTTWKITWVKLYPHNAIHGLQAFREVDTYVFASQGAANFAAFATEIDLILAGTHTPVADYL